MQQASDVYLKFHVVTKYCFCDETFFLNPHIHFYKKNDKNVIYISEHISYKSCESKFYLIQEYYVSEAFLFHIRKEATQAISVKFCEMEQA